jgi:hypothetical protein
MSIASFTMPESTACREELRERAQALLDRWYPGTAVTVDWTGDTYLVQVSRAGRLAAPVWVAPAPLTEREGVSLARELIEAAWELARTR